MTIHKAASAGLFLILGLISQAVAQGRVEDAPQDSLTMALCVNEEQIVSRRTGDFRIDFYMGETQLNMKTMNGFLSLNSASLPYYRQSRVHRIGGFGVILAGIGLIVADGFIPKPDFPVITLGGIASAIWGLTIVVGANEKVRLAIYHYNRDICKIK
jgi:hypothetical protein